MKTSEEMLNKDIKKAFSAATPDLLGSVISSLDGSDGKVVSMERKQVKKGRAKWVALAAAAAAVIMVLGALIGVASAKRNANRVFATVMLDVNPSIELKVNKNEKVISVNALNEDARIIIGDMDFEGSAIDVAVNALIGSMLRKGYLSDIANSILVTVDNADARKGAELQKRLAAEIESVLKVSIGGAVISQTAEHSPDDERIANEYGVSIGKAQLIRDIIKTSPRYSPSELASLNINELNLIMGRQSESAFDSLIREGSPSENAYIGRERAIEIALEYANVNRADVIGAIKCEIEYEHGRMVYEVEFGTADAEYDADIDAVTGAVTDFEVDKRKPAAPTQAPAETVPPVTQQPTQPPALPTQPPAPTAPPVTQPPAPTAAPVTPAPAYIGEEAAKRIAFERAGVAEGDVRQLKIKLDTEHGVKVYDVEFKAKGYEYDIEVNAITGAIVKFERELDDDASTPTPPPTQPPVSGGLITAAEAKSIALKKAGVTASQITEFEIELEKENGVYVYEVGFKANGYEYDIKVDAKTGKVLAFERELDDDNDAAPAPTQPPAGASTITSAEAKSIALKKAGVTASQITEFEIELEKENGVLVYEIKFKANWREYSVEIDAKTGAVLDFDID